MIRSNYKLSFLGPAFDETSVDLDTQASIYLHMIQKWQQIHPEIKLTVKQIISIHHMLNYVRAHHMFSRIPNFLFVIAFSRKKIV